MIPRDLVTSSNNRRKLPSSLFSWVFHQKRENNLHPKRGTELGLISIDRMIFHTCSCFSSESINRSLLHFVFIIIIVIIVSRHINELLSEVHSSGIVQFNRLLNKFDPCVDKEMLEKKRKENDWAVKFMSIELFTMGRWLCSFFFLSLSFFCSLSLAWKTMVT